MKVYAVIEGCEDEYYPDYRVVDNCVYLKKEDARRRLDELVKENRYSDFEIRDFEVMECPN